MVKKDLYRNFGLLQLEILKELEKGIDYRKVAKHVREAITFVYGNPPSGSELGINVNNACNLSCKHCYYASTHKKELEKINDSLSEINWKKIINSSLKSGFEHFSIIGKEPLLSPAITRKILEFLENKKKEFPGIKYEMITNGTLIKKEIDWLKNLDFYFFSISFDGYKQDHDRIRGKGNYEKSKQGLIIAKKSGIKNLTISHCAMPHNVISLKKMIEDLSSEGAEYFSVSFCFETNFNKKEFSANIDVFKKVIGEIKEVNNKDIDISLNLSGDEHSSIIAKLYKQGLINEANVSVTSDTAPSLIIQISKNPRIAIQVSILPVMFYSGFRLDYNGKAIDFCDYLKDPQKKESFGNIKKTPIKELWIFAQRNLWKKYTEKYYKKLQKEIVG